MGLLASTLVGGCSPDESRFDSKTYRLPFPDAEGVYALREVELKTFSDPSKFRGDVAQIFVEPQESGGQLSGGEPVGRFIKGGDGVIVPADFVSLQATTVYAHMERFREIDDELGISSAIRWPLKIGIQTNVIDEGKGVSNNAVYDGRLDALLIVPYTGRGLPIAMNGGVLAHEHFHTIFQALVLSKVKEKSVVIGKPGETDLLLEDHHWAEPPTDEEKTAKPAKPGDAGKSDKPPKAPKVPRTIKRVVDDVAVEMAADGIPKRAYNGFLLRALNEGLADFWGWIYTGDLGFIEHSLPREGAVRRLDLESGRLPDSKTIRMSLVDLEREDKLRPPAQRVTLSYILGSQYARHLRSVALEMTGESFPSLEARLKVGRVLLEILPGLAVTAATEFDRSFLSPNFILKPLTLKMGKLGDKACERLRKFKAKGDDFALPESCPKKPDDEETPEVEGVPVE